MAAVSMGLGWYAVNSREAADEVHVIDELSGMVEFGYVTQLRDDESLDCGTGVSGVVRMRWQGPGWLRRESAYDNPELLYRAEEVTLYSSDFDDKIVDLLPKLRHLRVIELYGTSVSPSGIQRLRSLLPSATVRYGEAFPSIDAMTTEAASGD